MFGWCNAWSYVDTKLLNTCSLCFLESLALPLAASLVFPHTGRWCLQMDPGTKNKSINWKCANSYQIVVCIAWCRTEACRLVYGKLENYVVFCSRKGMSVNNESQFKRSIPWLKSLTTNYNGRPTQLPFSIWSRFEIYLKARRGGKDGNGLGSSAGMGH